ncbi:helix-turn-helix domain-containing protein [Kribbella sindirgiensis]|uniref:XRE family transcriptional regulator n=1 Tax=Kribbella sindirgiensis TaxID=1124744 RepID=A0A4R0I539_9ACTN|nr:helix-turn-helix transcriptional regulator [Kribbella sindirgiensis]TCC23323.1 XRE family transcriptional regulator [Kribbella sindirgiensis]
MELGEVLRDRRKAAGRTIASVAVDAGLSVPYIANLENGRGNPTIAALDRLATALGARLDVRIGDEEPVSSPSVGAELVAGSDRVDKVLAAVAGGRSRAATRRELIATLDALAVLLGRPPGPADLSRLLDLLQLA